MSRCGLISTRYLATCGHARRSPALLIVPDDELAQRVRPDRDPSPWRRCRWLAAAHAVDGLHEGSGLDVTAELQQDEKRIRRPPGRMPKERRCLDQRDGHASEERPDPAFERPFPAIPLRPLVWIDARTE